MIYFQLICALIFFAAGVCSYFFGAQATNLILIHLVNGFAGGMISVAYVIYTDETGPSCIRGLLISRKAIAMTLGGIITAVIKIYFHFHKWTEMQAILIISIAALAGFSTYLATVESPSFLLCHRRVDQHSTWDIIATIKNKLMRPYNIYQSADLNEKKSIHNSISNCFDRDLKRILREILYPNYAIFGVSEIQKLSIIILMTLSAVLLNNLFLNSVITTVFHVQSFISMLMLLVHQLGGIVISSILIDDFPKNGRYLSMAFRALLLIIGIAISLYCYNSQEIYFMFVSPQIFFLQGLSGPYATDILSISKFQMQFKSSVIANVQSFEALLQVLFILIQLQNFEIYQNFLYIFLVILASSIFIDILIVLNKFKHRVNVQRYLCSENDITYEELY